MSYNRFVVGVATVSMAAGCAGASTARPSVPAAGAGGSGPTADASDAGPAAASQPPSASRFSGEPYRGGALPASPVTVDELALLQATLLFTDEDVRYLQMSRAVLEPQTDALLDVWYGFVGSTPHLLRYFSSTEDEVQKDYLAAVRVRFHRWILDTADANFDAHWLAYQHEIGRRHHRVAKNRTDGANAAPHIHFRYLIALTYPIVHTMRPFLERGGHSRDQVDGMQRAWLKAVLLQVILWSHPYVRDGEF